MRRGTGRTWAVRKGKRECRCDGAKKATPTVSDNNKVDETQDPCAALRKDVYHLDFNGPDPPNSKRIYDLGSRGIRVQDLE